MFSGIIEAKGKTSLAEEGRGSIQLSIKKPSNFDDLKVGDSISCSGVCLTVESFDEQNMVFSLGNETLKVTGWTLSEVLSKTWNLERSLKFGDRIHGHLVSGHVDGIGEVLQSEASGDCWLLKVRIPQKLAAYVWEKSSITLEGVSLTVNQFADSCVEVCLVPETMRKTTLPELKAGDRITVETDYYMKGMLAHAQSTRTH